MKTLVLALLAFSPLAAHPLQAQVAAQGGETSALETRGRIDSVTVYRGQALVTRAVDLQAAAGTAASSIQEIVVTDLPQYIRPESLHAEAEGTVRVRSVSFRTRPVVQDTREDVRKIDMRIEQLQDQLNANKRKQELLNEHRAYLSSLQGFVAPTATAELTKGVLNAETLEKLSTFLRTGRDDLMKTELELAAEAKNVLIHLNLAQRERERLTSGASRTVYEAVILASRDGGAGGLKLRYLVDNATWSPSYNVRASATAGNQTSQSAVTLEYYASIQQMSGEDWGDVQMTLSTATPSLVAKSPRLTPLTLSLGGPVQPVQLAYADAKLENVRKRRDLEVLRAQNRPTEPAASQTAGGQVMFAQQTEQVDKNLNLLANDDQVLDLIAGIKLERAESGARVQPTEGLAVTYTIPSRTTLPSRNDRQLLQIAAMPVQAEFSKLATPVLTGYVYDEASATNTTPMVLLAGPVTAYADGAFVGSGEMPTIASGQKFSAGLGIDSSLATRRELVDRTESIQGGNKVVTITYRLSLENFADAPAQVRLLDRLPKPLAGSDIKVTMVSSGAELSKEDEYSKGLKKEGILRWDVQVPPKATGLNAYNIEYTFRIEHDKQMSLVGMGI